MFTAWFPGSQLKEHPKQIETQQKVTNSKLLGQSKFLFLSEEFKETWGNLPATPQ